MIVGFAWAYAVDVSGGGGPDVGWQHSTGNGSRWLGFGAGRPGLSCEGYGNAGSGNMAGDAFTRTP